jgi:hypothetical protein
MTGTGSKALAMMALSVVIMTGGQAQTASKGREDGIHVHGYWTIKVSEPDGKIVRHVEFENSLAQNTGGAFLMALLTGQSTASSLAIGLVAHFGQGGAISAICNHVAYFDWNLDYGCAIASSGGQFYASCIDVNGCFTGLTVTLPTATLSNNQWVISGITLSGQMTAEASATIAGVMSLFLTCTNGVCPTVQNVSPLTAFPPIIQTMYPDNGFAPVNAVAPFGMPLTSALFATSNCGGNGQPQCVIPVVAGQLVSASVTISFQ